MSTYRRFRKKFFPLLFLSVFICLSTVLTVNAMPVASSSNSDLIELDSGKLQDLLKSINDIDVVSERFNEDASDSYPVFVISAGQQRILVVSDAVFEAVSDGVVSTQESSGEASPVISHEEALVILAVFASVVISLLCVALFL